MKTNGRSTLAAGGLLLGLSLAACAHEAPLSAERLAAAEAPVRAAGEAGANSVPAAAYYLKLARDEIAAAKRLAADGDDRASLVLARASADAELALALAKEKTAVDEARAALDEVEKVERQN